MDIEIGISKFKNIGGVTCYMNSVLAILQQIPIFTDYVISNKYKNDYKDNNYDQKVSFQLHKLFRISMSMDSANLTPSSLRKACSDLDSVWGEFQQQDSCEFLQFVISKMEEELSKKVEFIPKLLNNLEFKERTVKDSLEIIRARKEYQNFVKNEFSILKTFFTGLEKENVECLFCKNRKSNFQTFSIWQLPIPINKDNTNSVFSLEDCMIKWSEEEKLDDVDRVCCDLCGLKSNVEKKCSIFKPPKILIIQLKRFERNLYGNVTKKINNKVNFPISDLNIKKFMSPESPYLDSSNYNLIGVNSHIGVPNSGHYYSIVKNRFDNNWYNFNDDCKPDKVSFKSEILDTNAYLLFYFRVD